MNNIVIREVNDYHQSLNLRCSQLGISLRMYKILKGLVNLAAISLSLYAINEGLEPFLGILFAMLILQGPEVLEWWLVVNDYREYEDFSDDSE